MDKPKHECGIAAVYDLAAAGVEVDESAWKLGDNGPANQFPQGESSRFIPRMLLDMQNRGQLAAGMASYRPGESELLKIHKDVGTVTEVFQLSHQARAKELMQDNLGPAAIGHVRYATSGADDRCNAQPFERPHIELRKWFALAFNGQIANHALLREEILNEDDFHLARDTDTEVIMHLLSRARSGERRASMLDMLAGLREKLDGAWNIAYLGASGEMFVARDPLGLKPLCYALDGTFFAAASESVALSNMGFRDEDIRSLEPGMAILIEGGRFRIARFAEASRKAHCFFEWIYFANVASNLDDRSVYLARKRLGEELARSETLDFDRGAGDTIVVPVPDTAKASADGMAYALDLPCQEGLFRNRYVGRTFIEGSDRANKARMKYTPVREVLEGKRVLLVEDTIVRSTTMRALVGQLRERGGVKEIHVRVACPPIVSPCFYGIDFATKGQLFAAKYLDEDTPLTPEIE
ncbi:MAG: amidophosphoribosyltransferase, partial [Planctomycetota bacterium]